MSKKPVTRDVIEQVRREGADWRARLLLDARLRHAERVEGKVESDRGSRRRSAAEARAAKAPTSERNRKLAALAAENDWTAAQLRLKLLSLEALRKTVLGEGAKREDVPGLRQLQRIIGRRKRVS